MRDSGVSVSKSGYRMSWISRDKRDSARTRKGALGGRDAKGTKRSTAAMKCMLLRSVIEGRLILAAENVDTRSALSSATDRGGKSFGRIYAMLYPLTMMCPVYLSSRGAFGALAEEEDARLEWREAAG